MLPKDKQEYFQNNDLIKLKHYWNKAECTRFKGF